jgi:hypothetical protein
MHWEEAKKLSPEVQTCFANLDADLGTKLFPLIKKKNLSAEVAGILKWTSYGNYEVDMLSLK